MTLTECNSSLGDMIHVFKNTHTYARACAHTHTNTNTNTNTHVHISKSITDVSVLCQSHTCLVATGRLYEEDVDLTKGSPLVNKQNKLTFIFRLTSLVIV